MNAIPPGSGLQELVINFQEDQPGDAPPLVFELNSGHTYQVLLPSVRQKNSLLRRLACLPDSALVASDGGLISNLTAQENILLPVQYHSTINDTRALQDAAAILMHFGLDRREATRIFQTLPAGLSLLEKRLVGFARAMAIEPELLVCDTVFENLANSEMATIGRLGKLFHLHFPFRTVIFLELGHAHGIIHADKTYDLQ